MLVDNSRVTFPAELQGLRWVTPSGVDLGCLDILQKSLQTMIDRPELCIEPTSLLPSSTDDKRNLLAPIVVYIFEHCDKARLSEGEFTSCLAMFFRDPVEARRWGVDLGLVSRTKDGSKYRLSNAEERVQN